MKRLLCLITILGAVMLSTYGQKVDSAVNNVLQFPNRLFSKINSKAASLDNQLTVQTEKYLQHLAKKEAKLQRKLSKKDSAAAQNLFAGSQEKYEHYISLIKNETGKANGAITGEYLPYMDSLKGSLSFLSQSQNLSKYSPAMQGQITGSLTQVTQLQSKLQASEEIKQFIRDREQQLKSVLVNYASSLGFNKYLDDYNQQVYYYSEQVREYKEMFNDPDKMEQKALSLLNQLPAFQQFMKQNGQLASLFNIPGNYGSSQALEGLQTKDQIQALLQSQVGPGANAQQLVGQQVQSAESQLDAFKDKLGQLGSGSGDIQMPTFKPNEQKTKTFFHRLEFGTNLQTTRSNYYWPTTTDIGLSIGYKISNNGTIGIGGSYKIGWGSSINHVSVTNQGVGLRSYIDMKIKGSLYISGGYEANYQLPFNSLQQLNLPTNWTRSGLIGLTKMVSLKSKLVKKTKLQVLWDFLSYSQIPQTQPFVFRIGYNF